MVQAEKVEETSKHGVLGRHKTCSTERILKFYILHDTSPADCIPKAIMMETGAIIYEKVYASPGLLPKISFKDNWMRELGSEVVEEVKTPNKPSQKPKIQL